MLTRIVLAFASVLALAFVAPAQGLVQIAFSGSVAPPGGARVEVDVAFVCNEGPNAGSENRIELGMHLAQRTSAAELAQLVERELRRRGAVVAATFDPRSDGPGGVARGSLFIERTTIVGLRLGQGLSAQVCLCEDAPSLIRFGTPMERKELAHFALSASTEHPHSKERVRFDVAVDFPATQTGAVAADTLTTASIAKGWSANWLGHDSWAPDKLQSGARITGTCVTLDTQGDWRIEIELARRNGAR